MEGRFKKKGNREIPSINTGSMSDIIFMFLFFFMVITTIREAAVLVKVDVPSATEVQKLERKSLVSYIYIGVPLNEKSYGTDSRIQLNDQFGSVSSIADWVEKERAARNENERRFLTTSFKVDKGTKMGLVTDIKQELRKVGAYKISYSTKVGSVVD